MGGCDKFPQVVVLWFGGGYVVLSCLCCVLSSECQGVCWLGGWAHFQWLELLLGLILRFDFWDLARVEGFWGLSHFDWIMCAEIK